MSILGIANSNGRADQAYAKNGSGQARVWFFHKAVLWRAGKQKYVRNYVYIGIMQYYYPSDS